jgi:repressor LexA
MRKAPQRETLWQIILDELRSNGRFPAPHQLRQLLGVSEGRVRQLLQDLETQKLISKQTNGKGRSPNLSLTSMGFAKAGLGIPLVGRIRGGALSESSMEFEGYLNLPFKSACFALRVVGNSMADEILEGDVVLLDPNHVVSDGKICAVRVGHEEATLKRFYRVGAEAKLEPNNPEFETITARLEDVSIEGLMIGLIRGDFLNHFLIVVENL